MEQQTALIFNIQKFSIHDGPGIRTTIFFKGCPMYCKWCANPESKSGGRQLSINSKNCQKCLACIDSCPVHALRFDQAQRRIILDKSICTACFSCVNACCHDALTIEGEIKTLNEVFDEVMKDRVFYEKSGGGVTLSGGEVLAQADFAIALLMKLKAAGIHTAAETTGYAPTAIFPRFCGHLDLILFDVKHYNAQKHEKGTGVSNTIPLKNLRVALDLGKEVIARIPVIPDFNDSLADAQSFASLLADMGAHTVNLLPFHQFGANKYDFLGEEYLYSGYQAIQPEELAEYAAILEQSGLHVRIGG